MASAHFLFFCPGPGSRRCFLALHDGERASGPDHELFGIIVEALGQPPIGERGTADLAGTLGAGIDEGPAALAFEVRNAVLVDAQKYRAVEKEPEHQSFAEDAGAAEHAPDHDRAERREQVADEFGVHWAVPGFRFVSAIVRRSYDMRGMQ